MLLAHGRAALATPSHAPPDPAGTDNEQPHRGSAADLLAAARFEDYNTTPKAADPAWGGAGVVPWVVPDFVMSINVSSSRLDSQRAVRAQAAVDLFLCAGDSCKAAADLQYVSGSPAGEEGRSPAGKEGSSAAYLAAGYARIEGTTVGLPLGWLEPARAPGGEVASRPVDAALIAALQQRIRPGDDIVVKQVSTPSD